MKSLLTSSMVGKQDAGVQRGMRFTFCSTVTPYFFIFELFSLYVHLAVCIRNSSTMYMPSEKKQRKKKGDEKVHAVGSLL